MYYEKSIKRGSTSLPRHLYETRWPNNDSFLRRLARRQACNIFVGFWGASRTYSSQANELSACLSMAFRLNPPLSYTLLLSVSRRLLHSQSNQPSRCRAPPSRDPVAQQKRGSAVLSNRLPLVRLGWISLRLQLGIGVLRNHLRLVRLGWVPLRLQLGDAATRLPWSPASLPSVGTRSYAR